MLAAASLQSDRLLESVKLVLLLESKKQNYPSTLRAYFQDVIKQTNALLDEPSNIAATAMPEAVSLAVKMSSDKMLRDIFERFLGGADISSQQAEIALNCLEASFDANSELTHLSKEIYSAI